MTGGKARIRAQISASHSREELERALATFAESESVIAAMACPTCICVRV
jgi:hypothetical protein